MRAAPGEEILRQRGDNVPLRLIAILRLIDQNVFDALVEFVCNPIADFGGAQQARGFAHQIVEIDQPARAFHD